jgi:aspartate racemase
MGKLLGVLGGMGPLATVDFLHKLIEEAHAERDQEHVPVVAYSVPQMPERPPAITGQGESPLPHMLEGVRKLKGAGASVVAIACNTAHYWYDELVAQGGLPILHIADATCAAIAGGVTRVGLVATDGTLAAGIYQTRFAARGVQCVLNETDDQHTLVRPAIECVKRNQLARAHELAGEAVQRLLDNGAQAVILGCTELPLALDYAPSDAAAHCVDATRALARACVDWYRTA